MSRNKLDTMKVRSEISALVVAGIFGPLIGAVDAYFLPAFFPGHRTGWILNLGVLIAVLIGGYIGYCEPSKGTLAAKIILGICYAAVMAILVYFVALFIILNVRGS